MTVINKPFVRSTKRLILDEILAAGDSFIQLECREGRSAKWWHGYCKSSVMGAAWGAIGSPGQDQRWPSSNPEAAATHLVTKTCEKLMKGYKPVNWSAGFERVVGIVAASDSISDLAKAFSDL